tara:strand:+ start:1287 stop:1454 length:168 start_codon:yes stop_codon:yes gene_type:complete
MAFKREKQIESLDSGYWGVSSGESTESVATELWDTNATRLWNLTDSLNNRWTKEN